MQWWLQSILWISKDSEWHGQTNYSAVPLQRGQISRKSSQRHLVAHQLRWGMGCLLWIQILIYILVQSLQGCIQYRVIWDPVITAFGRSSKPRQSTRTNQKPCTFQWRYNKHRSVLNQQHLDCLLNGLFRRTSKTISNLRVTDLREGNPPVTVEFPSQRAGNAENVHIWLRHHDLRNSWDILQNSRRVCDQHDV